MVKWHIAKQDFISALTLRTVSITMTLQKQTGYLKWRAMVL